MQAYQEIEQRLVSETVFSQYMYKTLPSCNHLWAFKKQFCCQMALSGTVNAQKSLDFCASPGLPTHCGPICSMSSTSLINAAHQTSPLGKELARSTSATAEGYVRSQATSHLWVMSASG